MQKYDFLERENCKTILKYFYSKQKFEKKYSFVCKK